LADIKLDFCQVNQPQTLILKIGSVLQKPSEKRKNWVTLDKVLTLLINVGWKS